MRRILIVTAALFALAACGDKTKKEETPPVAPPVVEAPAPTIQALTGIFSATSNTAMSITGDLSVIAERVTLAKGEQFETAPATELSSNTRLSAGGKSFAETAVGPTSLIVELRKVTAASVAEGETPQKVCGPAPVTYVAFAYDAAHSAVVMMPFSGDEPPGDTATKSTLCGTFSYNE
jgi:hypothetical protein